MAKKAVTKKVSSTKKNSKLKMPALNRRTFTLGLLGVLVMSIIGATGYSAYNSKNDINAKAESWVYYYTNVSGLNYRACRYATAKIGYYVMNQTNTTYYSSGVTIKPHSNSKPITVYKAGTSITNASGWSAGYVQPTNYC